MGRGGGGAGGRGGARAGGGGPGGRPGDRAGDRVGGRVLRLAGPAILGSAAHGLQRLGNAWFGADLGAA
ncbi:hypothetical protein CCS92_33235, partial [Methylobacterium radiotolerans]